MCDLQITKKDDLNGTIKIKSSERKVSRCVSDMDKLGEQYLNKVLTWEECDSGIIHQINAKVFMLSLNVK